MKDTDKSMHAETLQALHELRDEMRALHEETRRVSATMQTMASDIRALVNDKGR